MDNQGLSSVKGGKDERGSGAEVPLYSVEEKPGFHPPGGTAGVAKLAARVVTARLLQYVSTAKVGADGKNEALN